MAQLLRGRRTHRAYLDREIPRETIEEIINVARYGPSGHNSQITQWLVISDKGEIRRIGQAVIDFMKANKEPNREHAYPWDYYGTDSDRLVDLWENGEDSIFRGAPHLIILYGPGFMRDYNAGGKAFPCGYSPDFDKQQTETRGIFQSDLLSPDGLTNHRSMEDERYKEERYFNKDDTNLPGAC